MQARWLWAVLIPLFLNSCNTPRLDYNPPPPLREGTHEPQIPLSYEVPAPTDRREAKLRLNRNRSYDKSNQKIHNYLGLGGHTFIDKNRLDRDFAPSPTVVLADITLTQSYLSQDRGNLYTEWTAQVRDVLAQTGPKHLREQDIIAINRVGGALKMLSGQSYEKTISGLPSALFAHKTYALFLTYDPRCDWFELDKSWGIENGKMRPTEPWDQNSSLQGISLSEFRRDYHNYSSTLRPPVRE